MSILAYQSRHILIQMIQTIGHKMKEKTALKWLGILFEREVALALKMIDFPYQLPDKVANPLIERGFVEEKIVRHGNLNMKFHRLTILGNYVYCTSPPDLTEEEKME
jgi:hypothetical protein